MLLNLFVWLSAGAEMFGRAERDKRSIARFRQKECARPCFFFEEAAAGSRSWTKGGTVMKFSIWMLDFADTHGLVRPTQMKESSPGHSHLCLRAQQSKRHFQLQGTFKLPRTYL